jgi:hypothetical protein
MIDWEIFFGSSYTVQALAAFVVGIYSFKTLEKECSYYKDCKIVIKSMKNKGYKKTRKNARQAMLRRGYPSEDLTWDNFHWVKFQS